MCLCLQVNGQDTPLVYEIKHESGASKTALPFNIPFTLKIIYKSYIKAENISLFEIKGKKYNEYLNIGNSITHNEVIQNANKNFYTDSTLTFSVQQNDSQSWSLLINIPPLRPDKYYDIRILRRPDQSELEKYFDLFHFHYLGQDSMFLKKLRYINQVQSPYEHISIDSTLDTTSLLKFYKTYQLDSIYYSMHDSTVDETDRARNKQLFFDIINSAKLEDTAGIISPNFLVEESVISSTTIYNFENRNKFKISPDLGYVFYGFQKNFTSAVPYFGVHFEFGYYNKNIPFSMLPKVSIWDRLSLSTGITIGSLKSENKREDLFDGKSLLIGFGIKFTTAIRGNFGFIIFKKEDTNPLIDNKKLASTPFTGLSIDLNLKSLIHDLTLLNPLK